MKKLLFCLLLASCYLSLNTSPVHADCEPPNDYSNCLVDWNLDVRGYESISGYPGLIDFHHDTDTKAPQLSTLIEKNPRPTVTSLYQVYNWNQTNTTRVGLWQRPPDLPPQFDFATLVGFGTTPGQAILVPDSGYNIGGGYEVMVLFANSNSITLKYTREETISWGYTIYLKNFSVDPEILSFYNQLNQAGRKKLPILCAGQKVGEATGSEIQVAVVDTGSFMDPRWQNDWWQHAASATTHECPLISTEPLPVKDEKFITIGGSSHVCSDFIEKRKEKFETIEEIPLTPTPVLQASTERIFLPSIPGNISLETIKFPRLEQFQRRVVSLLRKTLSPEYVKKLTLPGSTKMYFKHFAQGQSEGGEFDPGLTTECDETPESEVTVPAQKWGRLAGAIRGLCGYLSIGLCQPVTNYQFKLAEEGYSCGIGSCAPGQEVAEERFSPENKKTDFSVAGWVNQTIETLEEIVGNFLKRITKTTRDKEVKFLSRAKLPGGRETAKNSEFFYSDLPQEVIEKVTPRDEAKALTVGFRYNVAFSPVDPGEHHSQYYQLRKMRNLYCMRLCTLYPHDKPISDIDPICPSCDPNDKAYQDPSVAGPPRTPCKNPDGTPDWSRDPQDCAPSYCHWDYGIHACHYYLYCQNNSGGLPHCERFNGTLEHGCGPGQDPVCENCSGLPDALYPDTDLGWCGGQGGPKSCWPNKGEVRCKYLNRIDWENDLYDDPAYNGCYYANETVKVRKDFVGCGGVCNDACPAD